MLAMVDPLIQFVAKAIAQVQASDLYIRAGRVWLRTPEGVLEAAALPEFTREEIRGFVEAIHRDGFIPKDYLEELNLPRSVDFAVALPTSDPNTEVRLRFHGFRSRGEIVYAVRLIPPPAHSIMELGIETAVQDRLRGARGLFLVTGPTGAGKSTTLAALLQYIADHQHVHIVTLEDPIEYVISPGKAVVHQRELHKDFSTFPEGLRSVLRESPDVVMVGEVRDLDTLRWTLSLAEAGFLVLASYHTRSPQETVERIVGSFPDHEQNQARMRLATTLVGVLSQILLPATGPGVAQGQAARRRVVAYEYMIVNDAIRTMIREQKTHNILNAITSGVGVRFEDTLARLVRNRLVREDVALANAPDPALLRQKLAYS